MSELAKKVINNKVSVAKQFLGVPDDPKSFTARVGYNVGELAEAFSIVLKRGARIFRNSTYQVHLDERFEEENALLLKIKGGHEAGLG